MEIQQAGLKKWQDSAWKELLEMVLPALDELPKELIWTLGGGTALALSFNHRISYDIDIFFQNTNALKLLSPFRNRKIRSLSDNWQQPGNYIKIERPEGDIDFLIAFSITEKPFFIYDFKGKEIFAETSSEIIAKKIYYRGSQFTVRDIFDLAVFFEYESAQSLFFIPDISFVFPRVLDRVKLLKTRYEQTIYDAVIPTESGKIFLDKGADTVIRNLELIVQRQSNRR